ncbi:MAG: oligopeptide transporter, OPT family, partial [bacterium]
MDDEKILSKKNNNINTFKPYIAADRTMTEFSFVSIVLGALIAVIFGAANAYLGLKVGLTISASIPAAVISMGIIRGIMRRKSILENNMVQTIGSAGESLAAGVIFTIPVLFLWASQYDSVSVPGVFKIFLISLFGGFIGVVMMIPLRKFLIVQEHNRLPYPEGTACGDILVAGEEGGSKATTVFAGLGIGALFKFLQKGIGLFSESVETVIPGIKNAAVGADIQPALLGVGFIIGPKISAYMLGGAVLGWLCFIPAISIFGAASSEIIPPALGLISDLDHWEIWNRYIRYIGAGAVAFAGIISLLKSLPVILKSFKSALGGFKIDRESQKRTERDIPMKIVVVIIAVIIVILAFLPQIPTGIIGALLVAVFGFFFVTVSSRIVGVVGSSSNPVSGMTIATLLLTTLLLKAVGITGIEGMVTAITVGGLVCIAAAIAGDTSQDLKSGFIVGATPWKQQIGEFIGVFVSALVMGSVLYLLHNTYGFGSKELAAPQATLMKLVIEGVMQANLPWGLVFIGAASAAVIELLGVSALPFAVGLYLPLHLSTPVMIGGVVRGVLGIFNSDRKKRSEKSESGVLYSSGLIAGEGVMGIIIASFVFFGV